MFWMSAANLFCDCSIVWWPSSCEGGTTPFLVQTDTPHTTQRGMCLLALCSFHRPNVSSTGLTRTRRNMAPTRWPWKGARPLLTTYCGRSLSEIPHIRYFTHKNLAIQTKIKIMQFLSSVHYPYMLSQTPLSVPRGFSEESRTHGPPLPLHPVARHGCPRIHPACPVLHQSILPSAYTGDGTCTGTLQVRVCVFCFWSASNKPFDLWSVSQCWCRKDRNIHSGRQHAAADPGSGYSERSWFSKTCADAKELPGSDGGKPPDTHKEWVNPFKE